MESMKTEYVHPEDPQNMLFWCQKWSVSHQELYEAILNTGCLEADKLEIIVHRDKWLYHPISGTVKLLKAGINMIF